MRVLYFCSKITESRLPPILIYKTKTKWGHFCLNREVFLQFWEPSQLKPTNRPEIEQFKSLTERKKGAKLVDFQFFFAIFRHFFKIRQLKSRFSKMRKSGSAVLLLLGYANSVDAMSRVRRGSWDWFGKKSAAAEEATTTTTTTTADPFNDPFFNDRIRLLIYERWSLKYAHWITLPHVNITCFEPNNNLL